MASYATYDVRVAWSSKPTNAFTIGTSTLGGGDVLVGQFGDGGFLGAYNDVTLATKRISIDRGRDDFLAKMRAGRCTITLVDLTGLYNPKNASSPLTGQLLPMRPMRVRATFQGTTYGLFYGFVRSIEHNPNARETVLECEDLFLWLSRVQPTIAAGALTTGDAIRLILDAVGWTDPTMRSLDIGDPLPAGSFAPTGTTDALSLINGLLDTERGVCYIDGSGVFTYENRLKRAARAKVATFTGTMADFKPGVDLDKIKNRAVVTKTGSTAQTVTNPNSIAAYGVADAAQITSPYLPDDNTANNLAAYIVQQFGDAVRPARSVTLFNENDALLTQILARELVDRVTLTEPKGNTSGDFHIEKMTDEIWSGGKIHQASWSLAERGSIANPFLIGSSTLGGGDVLSY